VGRPGRPGFEVDEAFTDVNGNGTYDPGEPFTDLAKNGKYDPGETYTDSNHNGTYDLGEPFTDLAEVGHGVYDTQASFSHPNVTPAGVFLQNGAAVPSQHLGNHAEQVAGVMISNHGVHKGVARGASLYSSAYNEPFFPAQPQAALSAQHVAQQNGGDIRAINLSFGEPLVGGTPHNGTALLSQFVDWSSMQHDVLYVTAADESGHAVEAPQDSFNRINVGYTEKDAAGVFRQVDAGNVFTTSADGRRLNDIVAPGDKITMPTLGGGHAASSGTSFAAPHATGTVALLQEHGDAQIAASKPHWDTDARRHQVMKAVLMNSVDKVKDTGDGRLLGMEKTILDTNGLTWLQSDAATSKFIPLDDQMGTGQLNAKRALQQFKPGEWDSFGSAEVPLIGWDWGLTLGAGDINEYIFDTPLLDNSYVSITLAWDREIQLNDTVAANGLFDVGESFTTLGLTDMDLYLLPKSATDISEHIWASYSLVDPVEHIFFKIPESGDYKFWVHQFNQPLGDQFYGVAWWAKPVPEPSTFVIFAFGLGIVLLWRKRLMQ
jgi:subtilase family protein/PEP-CTERM motif-containing protein